MGTYPGYWSLRHLFRNANFNDFYKGITALRTALCEEEPKAQASLKATFYRATPHKINHHDAFFGYAKQAQEDNNKLIIKTVDNLTDITEDLWNQSGYVEANIEMTALSSDKMVASGSIEAKGFKPEQISFNFEPIYMAQICERKISSQYGIFWNGGDPYDGNKSAVYRI